MKGSGNQYFERRNWFPWQQGPNVLEGRGGGHSATVKDNISPIPRCFAVNYIIKVLSHDHVISTWKHKNKQHLLLLKETFAFVIQRPYCPGRPKKLCFTTQSLAVKTVGAKLSVVKQSFFGLPGQCGRRVTKANSTGKIVSSFDHANFPWHVTGFHCASVNSQNGEKWDRTSMRKFLQKFRNWWITGFAPFFRNKFPGLFQDFSRPQIEFSRTLKFTLTRSFPRSQC